LHLTEGRNTGLGKITNALEYNGSPPPVFETDDERLSFVTILYLHPEFPSGVISVLDNVPDNVPDNVSVSNTPSKRKIRHQKLVAIIKENGEITTDNLAALLEVSHKTIQRDLAQLKEEGRVIRSGFDSKGNWEVID